MKRLVRFTGLLLALLLLFSLLAACTADEVDLALNTAAELLETEESAAPFPEAPAPVVLPAEEETPAPAPDAPETPEEPEPTPAIDEDGVYTSKDELALYIHTYGHLPSNFITKDEARAAGWSGGSLEKFCPGKCIGGDRFGNREGLLPAAKGRTWTECDVNTLGASSRGAERIVFSNDGLIYYTGDHYDSFQQLY